MKQLRRIISGVLAVSLATAAGVSASAEGKSNTIDDVITSLHRSDVQYAERESMTDYYAYYAEKVKTGADLDHTVENTDKLPSSFDLRNVNGKCYVSPVKNQNPWPTCWSFGACAAAEISLAYAFDYDYNDKDDPRAAAFDLSEKQLAWFMYYPLPENNERFPTQAGEGLYSLNYDPSADNQTLSAAIYGPGGYMATATTAFSAGIGPVLESIVPYEGKDAELYPKNAMFITIAFDDKGMIDSSTMQQVGGGTMTDEQFEAAVKQYEEQTGYKYYDYDTAMGFMATGAPELAGQTILVAMLTPGNGDWTVDEQYRFMTAFDLVEGVLLPNPAKCGENCEYIYDASATAAIKNELVNGRGVAIGFKADQAQPGQQIGPESFLNFVDENGKPAASKESAAIWAHYTFDRSYDPTDKSSVNHKVFTSNHAVCIVGYDDNFPKEYFNDPNGTIGGNGAWLVKNSWGSVDAEDPAKASFWGNNGSGYFWLSYYDQSIEIPESFKFADNKEEAMTLTNIDMYDLMPQITRDQVAYDDDVYMANIFTPQNNCTVRFIGIETVDADTTVKYSIYFLNDDPKSPTDGYLALEEEVTFPYAGYHRIDLGRSMPQAKGTKYSIVAQVKSNGSNKILYNHAKDKNGLMTFMGAEQTRWVNAGNTAESFSPDTMYSKGIVNKGESFIGVSTGNGYAWADWADVTKELKKLNDKDGIDYFTYDNFPIRSYPETELFTAGNFIQDEQSSYAAGDVIKGILVLTNNSDIDFAADNEIELVLNLGEIGENNSRAKFSGLKAGETRTVEYNYTVTDADVKAGKVESFITVKVNGEDIGYDPVFDNILGFTVNLKNDSVSGISDENPATGTEGFAGIGIIAAISLLGAFALKKRCK